VHLRRLTAKCTAVRPVIPGQEVVLFLKGLVKPEYAAAARVVMDQASLVHPTQQSLEWAVMAIGNAMDNAANAFMVCTWAQDERPADLRMAQPNVG
jgi:hypothetical protein